MTNIGTIAQQTRGLAGFLSHERGTRGTLKVVYIYEIARGENAKGKRWGTGAAMICELIDDYGDCQGCAVAHEVDEFEISGDLRRFRITKEDIERVGYSDGCVGYNAARQGTPTQRHSEYCRRPIQEDLRGSEEGRWRLDKAEE